MRQVERASRILIGLAAGLVGGCGTQPAPVDLVEATGMPANWEESGAAGGPAKAGWVRTWKEPELEALLEQVQTGNRDLRMAAARMEAALAAAGLERAQGIPTVDANLTGNRARQNIGEQPQVQTGNRFSAGLTLNWEVDVWGRLANLRTAAQADAEAASQDYAAARLSLMVLAARTWFNLRAIESQVGLAEASYTNFQIQAERAQRLFERGTGGALDAALLQAQADSARANVQALKAQRAEVQRQLKVLSGEYPTAREGALSQPLPDLPPALPAGLPSELVNRRPDVLAAQLNLEAAELRARAAVKRRFPAFALTGSAGTASDELENLTDGDFSVWSLAGNLVAPVFQAGRITRSIQAARAQYELALAAYERAALQAFRDVETAIANEAWYRARVESLTTAVESASRAERLAQDRYERGLVPVATLLEAQRRQLDTQSTRIVAMNELHQNRLSLILALGTEPF